MRQRLRAKKGTGMKKKQNAPVEAGAFLLLLDAIP